MVEVFVPFSAIVGLFGIIPLLYTLFDVIGLDEDTRPITKRQSRQGLLAILVYVIAVLLGPVTLALAGLVLVGGLLYGLGVLIYNAIKGEDE